MSAVSLLEELQSHGVVVNAYKGDIVCGAPAGIMTPERLAALREHKAELLALLTAPTPTPLAPGSDGLIERMRELGFVPDPDGPGWAMTPERAAMCARHSDRPLAPGDKLFCRECRSDMRATVGDDCGSRRGVEDRGTGATVRPKVYRRREWSDV